MDKDVREFIGKIDCEELVSFAGVAELKTDNGTQVGTIVSTNAGSLHTASGYVALWTNIMCELCKKKVLDIENVKAINDITIEIIKTTLNKDMNNEQVSDLVYDSIYDSIYRMMSKND